MHASRSASRHASQIQSRGAKGCRSGLTRWALGAAQPGISWLHESVVRACGRIGGEGCNTGFWLRLNRLGLGSLPLVRADSGLVLAGKRWRAKVIVMACCPLDMSQQAAVLRRTHVHVHPACILPYRDEYATFLVIIARLGTLAYPEDYALPWALPGSSQAGTREIHQACLSLAVRIGPEHVLLAQCHWDCHWEGGRSRQ